MESAPKTAALKSRALLANQHWGSFLSKLPYRATSMRSLQDPPATMAIPAEKSVAGSELNALWTSNTDSK
jgi:hypothetical protein